MNPNISIDPEKQNNFIHVVRIMLESLPSDEREATEDELEFERALVDIINLLQD